MKVIDGKFDYFVGNIEKFGIFSCLLYGENSGLVFHRTKQIIEKFLINEGKKKIVSFYSEEIEKDPQILYEEFFSPDLMSGRKVIKIYNANNKISKTFEEFEKIETKNSNSLIILNAEEFDSRSKLRLLHENHEKMLSVPCYFDNERTSFEVIKNFFNDRKIKYESGVIEEIIRLISGDRMILLNELERIDLYLGHERDLSSSIVEKVVNDSKITSIDQFIDSFCLKNKELSLKFFDKILNDGNMAIIAIIRILLTHFANLEEAILSVMSGTDVDNEAKRRVFFKRITSFKEQMQIWSLEKISKITEDLIEIEITSKTTSEEFAEKQMKMLILLGNL